MDPAIITLAALIEKIGAWPLGLLICLILIGPWMILMFVSRAQEHRFEEMRLMYENNVRLVENYEKMSKEKQDVIIMNTQAVTELKMIIKERIK